MPTVPSPHCVEEGCDRPAPDGDARCGLHSARLGPLRDPRPPSHVVVPAEQILEAPAAVDRTAARFRTRTTITWVMVAAQVVLFGVFSLHGQLAEPDWDLHKTLFSLFLFSCAASPIAAVVALRAASSRRRRAIAWTALLVTLAPWVWAALSVVRPRH